MDDQGTTGKGGGVAPKRYVQLRQHEGESAAVVELYDHPHELVSGIIAKSVELDGIISENGGHTTPRLWLHFDKNGRAIEIEIIDWGHGEEE